MANRYYTTSPIAGVDLQGVDTSAQGPKHMLFTQVDVFCASLSTGAGAGSGFSRAIYVKAGQVISASVDTPLAWGGTDGTVSVSAGGLRSMHTRANAAAGDFIWVRTSANLGG